MQRDLRYGWGALVTARQTGCMPASAYPWCACRPVVPQSSAPPASNTAARVRDGRTEHPPCFTGGRPGSYRGWLRRGLRRGYLAASRAGSSALPAEGRRGREGRRERGRRRGRRRPRSRLGSGVVRYGSEAGVPLSRTESSGLPLGASLPHSPGVAGAAEVHTAEAGST